MSFIGRSAVVPTARTPNTAELIRANSAKTAEARQARVVAFVPTFVAHILSTIKTSSTTELAPMKKRFALNPLITMFGINDVHTRHFPNSKLDTLTDSEKDFILKEAKTILEDPVKHGLTVDIIEQVMTVDWSVPKVVETAVETSVDPADEKKQ